MSQKEHLFLYTGMLRCAECGKMITCEIKHGKWVYYHCTGNYGKCKNKSVYVREKLIDKQINEAIKNLQIDDSLADYLNLKLEESYRELQIMTKEKHEYIKREIEKINTRLDKLLTIYMDGDIDRTDWAERKGAMEEQKDRLKAQLASYDSADNKFINEGKNIIELAKNTYRLYAKQNINEKKRMIGYLLEDMVLDKDRVLFKYRKPFSFFAEINLKEDYTEIEPNKLYEGFELKQAV